MNDEERGADAVFETPPELPEVQQGALRVLLMVHELHRRGLHRVRIVPGMSPSGMHWRCSITPASNISPTHGALPLADEPQAHYSSADERRCFGWDDGKDATPVDLARLFFQRFPEIVAAGTGRDYAYVGWFLEVVFRASFGEFPIAYDDGYFLRENPARGQRCLPTTFGWDSNLPMPPPA